MLTNRVETSVLNNYYTSTQVDSEISNISKIELYNGNAFYDTQKYHFTNTVTFQFDSDSNSPTFQGWKITIKPNISDVIHLQNEVNLKRNSIANLGPLSA